MVRQGLLSTNDGVLDTTNNTYTSSDYIPIDSSKSYALRKKSNFTSYAPAAACYYTKNKTFISGQYGMGTVPSNAAYLRVSMQGLTDYGVFVDTVASWSDFVSPRVYPIYKGDLAKEYNKEQNEQFYRATLEGKLTFQRDDYAWILAQAFDFEYIITLYISYDAGYSWDEYWVGNFWKTDCDFDEDSQTVIVQPTVKDQYTDVLAGIEKEFNLIDLAPEMAMIKADKRPMIQAYIPGDSTVGCFLAGMSWEQECDIVTDENALVQTYNFALSASLLVVEVTSGSYSPEIPTIYTKRYAASKFNPAVAGTTEITNGSYKFVYYFYAGGGGATQRWQIVRTSDSTVLWEKVWSGGTVPDTSIPQTVILTPVSGSGASGNIELYVHNIPVYCRYVLDVETIMDRNTSPIPDDDIVENNRNYRRAIGYEFPDCVFFSTNRSSTPTKWGLYQPGEYYQKPAGEFYYGEFFPVSRREWGKVSVWFAFFAFDQIIEQKGRKAYTIKNNYPLWSVISTLLAKIAPGVTHAATTDYSIFLYSSIDPIAWAPQNIFLTPKSNIITADYDQPAQKAPVTLRKILDMLRDCFRLYWFIDDQNRFRIEHITWFMRGGSYSPSTNIARDLTQEIVSRNGKPWAFVRSQYKFDKPAMAERYEFGWMDEVTQLFEGFPIDITSKYVTPGNIQQIKIDQFTSDIDYMLLNPGACSKDGFALLSAVSSNVMEDKLYDYTFATVHGLPNFQTGIIDTSIPDSYKCSDLIDIENATQIAYTNLFPMQRVPSGNKWSGLVLYDSNGNFVESFGYSSNAVPVSGTLDLTNYPTAKYVRFAPYYNGSGVVDTTAKIIITYSENQLCLPYNNYSIDGNDHVLQNAYVAFHFLQRYYMLDMPARQYSINGTDITALGIKKLKTQSIRFPLLHDIDLNQLIKTTLGNGVIDKLSINLSSRNANATLKYDTE